MPSISKMGHQWSRLIIKISSSLICPCIPHTHHICQQCGKGKARSKICNECGWSQTQDLSDRSSVLYPYTTLHECEIQAAVSKMVQYSLFVHIYVITITLHEASRTKPAVCTITVHFPVASHKPTPILQRRVLQRLLILQVVKIFQNFMDLKGSLQQYTIQPTTI